jgi:hypothetical protein
VRKSENEKNNHRSLGWFQSVVLMCVDECVNVDSYVSPSLSTASIAAPFVSEHVIAADDHLQRENGKNYTRTHEKECVDVYVDTCVCRCRH